MLAAAQREFEDGRITGLGRREPQHAEYPDRRLKMNECVADHYLGAALPPG